MRPLDFILWLLTPWAWFKRSVASEPVPAPVQVKPYENSRASTQSVEPPAPVSSETASAIEPVQPVKTKPPAAEQAQALLEFLHRSYAGRSVRAVDVKRICYPQLLNAIGWRAQPWDGKNGVGAHLGRLTGGRTFAWFDIDGERKRQRAYRVPIAITVRILLSIHEARSGQLNGLRGQDVPA